MVTPEEWDFFIAHATCFLTNMGNYLAFGDMKIVPGITEHQLDVIVRICPLKVGRIWAELSIFSPETLPCNNALSVNRQIRFITGKEQELCRREILSILELRRSRCTVVNQRCNVIGKLCIFWGE